MNSYFESLDPRPRKRYIEKISVVGGIDPYAIKSEKFDCNVENFPAVTYPDIVNYIIFSSSPFTANQLEAYKSLEAYNQVIEGWVRDVKVYLYEGKRLVIGKVVTFIRIHSFFFFFRVLNKLRQGNLMSLWLNNFSFCKRDKSKLNTCSSSFLHMDTFSSSV